MILNKIQQSILYIVIIIFHFSSINYAEINKNNNNNKSTTFSLVEKQNIISLICINGLKNVKLQQILSVIKSKKYTMYSATKVKQDVKAILKLGYFTNVNFNYTNGILTFIVIEKPCIDHINFQGVKQFSIKKLHNITNLKKGQYYDHLMLSKAKQSLYAVYNLEGYPNCKIEYYETVEQTTNKSNIVFVVIENRKIIVKDIKITGVNNKEIYKQLKTRIGKKFVEDIYKKDLVNISNFYKNHGFLDYTLLNEQLVYNHNQTEVIIKLNISKGMQYRILDISFNGNNVITNRKLYRISKLHKNHIVNFHQVMENNNMYEAYRSKGYINVKIIPFIDKDRLNGKANIKYLVQENEIVSISNIYIDTDNFVKNKRLQNEIAFKPGNIFTYKKLYKSIFNLYNHKFIESVGYILVQTDIPNSFDIVFSFIERKPNIFNLGLGYSSKPKRLITSIQLENSNLFDLGQTLTLCYNLNYLGYEYNVHFMDPWVFNQNLSLDLNLLRTKTQVNNLNYKNTMNFLIELGTKLSDDIRIFLGYQTNNYYASNINIQTLPIMSSTQSKSLASPKTPFRIPSVLIRLIYDSRDNRHKPSKGIVHSFTMHVANRALGGQLSFIRKVFKTSFYCPLLFKMISSFNFEYGTISTNDETRKKLPFYELFYLGDFENIKGHGDNIHNYGCHKYMFNIENKFPLISINPTNELQGILFYDVGGIWKNPKEINLKFGNKTYNLHSSIGYGLQFGFKLLCMKISFVYNLYYDKYTPKRQIHINLFNSM